MRIRSAGVGREVSGPAGRVRTARGKSDRIVRWIRAAGFMVSLMKKVRIFFDPNGKCGVI
jgi:hypothetical protein